MSAPQLPPEHDPAGAEDSALNASAQSLQRMLAHAPDANLQVSAATRAAILAAAARAVTPTARASGVSPPVAMPAAAPRQSLSQRGLNWLDRWLPKPSGAWGTALAGVMVASFITLMWHDEPVPEVGPVAQAPELARQPVPLPAPAPEQGLVASEPASLAAAAPEPAQPAASAVASGQAADESMAESRTSRLRTESAAREVRQERQSSQERVEPPVQKTAPERLTVASSPARSSVAGEDSSLRELRAAAVAPASEAAQAPEPVTSMRRAPVATSKPAPAAAVAMSPAASDASVAASSAAPSAAALSESPSVQPSFSPSASSSTTSSTSPMTSSASSSVALPAWQLWTHAQLVNAQGQEWTLTREEAGELTVLLAAVMPASGESAAAEPRGAPRPAPLDWRIRLLQDERTLGILQLGGHQVRWHTPGPTQVASTPSPQALTALRDWLAAVAASPRR